MYTFWQELKRRKVIRVAVVYAIVAWIAIEVSSVLFPALLLPDWASRFVVALAMVGFPVAIGMAWALDLTPRGIELTDVRPDMAERPNSESFSPEDRLDGWKRIAQFLNRDVRTVRRWEKSQSLPVKRVMHEKGATVFAYRPELEQWLLHRDELAAKTKTVDSVMDRRPGHKWVWPLVSVLSITAVAYMWWAGDETKSIPFSDKDWVLITEFDNRTGEQVLDGTLEYALERELNNSQFVKVIARNRVNDVLQLMQLPPDTSLDIETGRQISLRDGDVSLLITGRIDKVGESYSLSASLVNPEDGVTLISKSEIAKQQTDILPTVTRLARDVREALGEELASMDSSDSLVSKVTTPSLRALQLYSQADAMMSSGVNRAQALPVLKQALLTDPNFASAHLLLHYLYKDRDEQELARTHLDRAMDLAETATERERLFILSTKHSYYPDEYEQAIEIGEILAGIYPDHFWAVSNLASLNQALGRYDQVYHYRLRRADLRPNVAWANLEATITTTVFDEPSVREPYLQRTRELSKENLWLEGNLRMLPFYESWLAGNLEKSLDVLEQTIADEGEQAIATHPILSSRARSAYLALGMLTEFRQLSRLTGYTGWMEVIVELDSGNEDALDIYAQNAQNHYWKATLLASAGKIEQAQAVIKNVLPMGQLPRPFNRANFKYIALGELALAEGQTEAAIRFLEQGLVLLSNFSMSHYLFATNSLARAHVLQNDPETAIGILQKASIERPWTIFDPGATYQWMRNQKLLTDISREINRPEVANEAAAELNPWLSLADSDFPIPVIATRQK